jgi:hypothetical protein
LNESDARALIAEQARSGETMAAFAARRGLSAGQIHWWRKKLRVAGKPAAADALPMVPVVLHSTTSARSAHSAPFVVGLGPERTLHVPQEFSESALRTLFRVLREEP